MGNPDDLAQIAGSHPTDPGTVCAGRTWCVLAGMLSLGVLTVAATLTVWAVMVPWADGSTAHVITSGSMEPLLAPGDVLIASPPTAEPLAADAVVTFRRSDGVVLTHRVVALDGIHVVTKGDANPVPDSDRIDAAEVIGIGTIVVPYIGLPRVWLAEGAWWRIAACLAGIALLVRGVIAGLVEQPPVQIRVRRASAVAVVVVVASIASVVGPGAATTSAAFAARSANPGSAVAAATLAPPTNPQTSKNSTLGLLCSLTVTWTAAAPPVNGYEYRFGYGAVPSGAWTATAGTTATSVNVLGVLPINVTVEVRSVLNGTTWASTASTTNRTLGLLCAG